MNSRRFPNEPPFSVADFTTRLQELTVYPDPDNSGWQGPPFILSKTLTSWLASPITNNNNSVTRTALLLDKCYPDQNMLPITAQEILTANEKKRCPLIFSILLEMGCGELVHAFHGIGMHDAWLPKPFNDLHRQIKDALPRRSPEDIKALANSFTKEQWKYFPLEFSYNMRPFPLDHQIRLPICDRVKAGDGGTAEVYKITVPEEFVNAELSNKIPCSTVEHERHGLCYQFALKNFFGRSQEMWDTEVLAYRRVHDQEQEQEHFIKYLGCFSQFGRDDQKKTHSILLEYGKCDLAKYFKHVDPPDLAEDAEAFWSALFNVVKPVRYIHDYTAHRGGRVENYDGWHGDIKPENILMTERPVPGNNTMTRRELKLADPGFVSFAQSSKTRGAHGTLRKLHGFTSTYGPPEVSERKSSVEEPWAVDIWSLGCVLSEAATWIVFSYHGLLAYSALRRKATKEAANSSNSRPQHLSPAGTELGIGDFFHNGRSVLPTVHQWHKLLRSKIRRDDFITDQVLDLIETELLVEQPNERLRAEKLCSRLDTILEMASESREHDRTPSYFQQYIRDARKQNLQPGVNPSQILEELAPEDDRAYSSPMSAFLTFMDSSASPAHTRINPIDARHSHGSGGPGPGVSVHSPERYHESSAPEVRIERAPTLAQVGTLLPEQSQTIFDVYYERREKEKKRLEIFTKASKKAKDEFLARFYLQRDIVFLVDNAGSMLQHWSEVRFVLTELAGKARNQDEDGMDLLFTRSTKAVKGARKDALELFAKAIGSPEVKPQANVPSNLGEKLHDLLWDWFENFKQNPRSTKRMTIIVLTDGQWYTATGNDEYDIDDKIVNFSKQAKGLNGFENRKRPVSIQFVSFGHDPSALGRLQRLDDTLQYYGVEDIVDTEPSSGDVYKMLLGSFNESFDAQNDTASTGSANLLTPASSNYSVGPSSGGSFSTMDTHYSTPRTTNDSFKDSLKTSLPSSQTRHPPSRHPRSPDNRRSERISMLGYDTSKQFTSSHRR